MKWVYNKIFPYPVLVSEGVASSDRDYVDGEFHVDESMTIDPITQKINLAVTCRLEQPSLKQLIDQGKAKYAIGVHCPKTFLRKLKISDKEKIDISFMKGELDDRVDVSAYVVCYESLNGFTSNEFHQEFGGRSFSIGVGSALAVVQPLCYRVNLNLLKALGSIFELESRDSVDGYVVDWDSDKIRIIMNPDDATVFKNWQFSREMWPSMLSSVYLCALVETLHIMMTDADSYSDKKWFEVIQRTAKEKDVAMSDNMNYLAVAQKLLSFPVRAMLHNLGD